MSKSLTDFNQSTPANKNVLEPYSVPKRISWNSISDQVMSVLNIEKGIFYTVVELLFRPDKAVKRHLFKNRNLLVNPIRFLVLSTTIATFVTFYYMENSGFTGGFEEGVLMVEVGSERSDQRAMEAIIPILLDLFKQFVNISYFFLVPAGAIVSWLFMKRSYNVPELSVAHCYMWSLVNCFTIVLTPLVVVSEITMIILGLLALVYPIYFYTKFFNQGIKGFLKALVINFMNYLLLGIFFVVLGYFYLRNVESLIFPSSAEF